MPKSASDEELENVGLRRGPGGYVIPKEFGVKMTEGQKALEENQKLRQRIIELEKVVLETQRMKVELKKEIAVIARALDIASVRGKANIIKIFADQLRKLAQ